MVEKSQFAGGSSDLVVTETKLSKFLSRYGALIRRVDFGLAFACVLGVWFSGGDMTLAIPALVLGFIFAVIGVAALSAASSIRKLIWCALVTVLLVAEGIFLNWHFHSKTVVTFRWPIAFDPPGVPGLPKAPAEPPDMPPANLPGPTLSKWGKAMFLCQAPPTTGDPQDPQVVIAEIRKNADIVGNAMGLSMVFNQIAYGFRFDVTANGPEGEVRMGGMQRFTIQIERATLGIFVTVTLDMGALGLLTMMPLDAVSAKTWANLVAQFTGISEDKCRML